MASFADLAEAIWTQLENRSLYPLPELFANGLNPAMRLMTLMQPGLLTQRIAATMPAYALVLDLREVAPRTHRVLRVLLGTAGADIPQVTSSHFVPLHWTTREALTRLYPAWLRTIAMPQKALLLGPHLLALWPRPPVDVGVTLTCAMVPTPATLMNQADRPDLDASVDDRLVDIATALLRMKEGQGDTEPALQQLSALLGITPPPAQASA